MPIKILRICFKGVVAKNKQTLLAIESGIKGWELLEYKELLASAEEYVGTDRVYKIAIDRSQNYLDQVFSHTTQATPTHYVYDPRTGSQSLRGLWEAFCLSIIFTWKDITPIAILTDLPVRLWRAQCSMVTACDGVIVTLMSPKTVSPICPHRRFIGPTPMAFSCRTLDYLNRLISNKSNDLNPEAVFTGSLYEPRTSILNQIQQSLQAKDKKLHILGRELGTAKLPDEEYWKRLVNAAIVVMTADQIPGSAHDWAHKPHLVYRYLEATACGGMLVAQHIDGIARYFEPGEHFIAYRTPEEAAELICKYLDEPHERLKIAEAGKVRAHQIINAKMYWRTLDTCLGSKSLI